MNLKRTYDIVGHAYFITFSCYKRRKLLDSDIAKRIIISHLASEIKKHNAHCPGFAVMPDHVHAIVYFPEPGHLSEFMKQLKRMTSFRIRRFLLDNFTEYSRFLQSGEPFWQKRYYDFNIHSYEKLNEKLAYMHENPVRAGLVVKAEEWPFSSASWYTNRRSVGVPIQVP